MKLLIVGCEYSGTTTLAHAIRDWFESITGTRIRLVHDHFKIPFTIGHAEDHEILIDALAEILNGLPG